MPGVITTLGAQRLTAGTFDVAEVRIGTLLAGQRYNATPDRTALVDASPQVFRTGPNFTVSNAGNIRQFNLRIAAGGSAIRASETGFFASDGTLLMLAADATRDLFDHSSSDATLLAARLAFVPGSGTPPEFTLSVETSTNLGSSSTTTTVTVTSSTGTSTNLPAVSNTNAGIVQAGQWVSISNQLSALRRDVNTASTGDITFTRLDHLIASKPEAEAGTTNLKLMSPLRTTEHMSAREWDGTAAQYAAITTKDSKVTYYVHES